MFPDYAKAEVGLQPSQGYIFGSSNSMLAFSNTTVVDKASISYVDINKKSPQLFSNISSANPITFTVTASALYPENIEYKFVVKNESSFCNQIQNYSSSQVLNWVPETEGNYVISVYVRSKTLGMSVDDTRNISFKIYSNNLLSAQVNKLTSDKPYPQAIGSTVVFTAESSGAAPSDTLYQFWVKAPGGNWSIKQEYWVSNTFSWNIPDTPGTYFISVYVKNKLLDAYADDVTIIKYEVVDNLLVPHLDKLAFSPDSPQVKNTKIIVTASVSGAALGDIQYQFWVKDLSGNWNIVQAYSNSNSYSWSADSKGTYNIGIISVKSEILK